MWGLSEASVLLTTYGILEACAPRALARSIDRLCLRSSGVGGREVARGGIQPKMRALCTELILCFQWTCAHGFVNFSFHYPWRMPERGFSPWYRQIDANRLLQKKIVVSHV